MENENETKQALEVVDSSPRGDDSVVAAEVRDTKSIAYLKWYFTTRAGWLGDYVRPPYG